MENISKQIQNHKGIKQSLTAIATKNGISKQHLNSKLKTIQKNMEWLEKILKETGMKPHIIFMSY